jgi:hypothetical protein
MIMQGYLNVALTTTINIILNALSLGRYLWLEGRVSRGIFRNWGRGFRYRPQQFVQPTTEDEIVDLVKKSQKLRVVGSGHSFNEGVVSEGALVSLDRYSGVVWKDLEKKQLAVKGGTRVRDISKALLEEGLAFEALPSHDAQSIAGIISTDVHGTGRDWGFVSESVVSLKIIDGQGEIYECKPTDDLFKAAIGGVGAVGIISEVVLQGIDRFNIEQNFQMSNLSYVEDNLDLFLEENEHFGIYLFPFTEKCQINRWNRTDAGKSRFGPMREFISISLEALLTTWIGNLLAYAKLMPKFSSLAYGMKKGTDLVMESYKAHNRTIYPLHQEMEFAIPFEKTFEVCQQLIQLYEELYPTGLPYMLLEVRFTPAGHNRTLIGAGRDRHSTWIDLICADSPGFEKYYQAASKLIKGIEARPHLGKWAQNIKATDLEELHQQHFQRFLEIVAEHDPEGKFVNAYTRRIFGLKN